VERGEFWAKHMGQKCGASGNILGEHIGNLENPLKTRRKQKKHSLQPLRKENGPSSLYAKPSP
jgi:hypothetical protein